MQIQNTNLPIAEIIPQVISELCINNTLVLSAPPGAGKSTLLPLYLLQTLPVNQKIIILEPKKLTTKSINLNNQSATKSLKPFLLHLIFLNPFLNFFLKFGPFFFILDTCIPSKIIEM